MCWLVKFDMSFSMSFRRGLPHSCLDAIHRPAPGVGHGHHLCRRLPGRNRILLVSMRTGGLWLLWYCNKARCIYTGLSSWFVRDAIMTWTLFWYYWPFVWGIHRSQVVDSHTKGAGVHNCVSFAVYPSRPFIKRSSCGRFQWFKTTGRSWRRCTLACVNSNIKPCLVER